MDVMSVSHFTREIKRLRIHVALKGPENRPDLDMLYLELCGNAFLWHQVRCIAAVLFMVGTGKEKPSIVDDMLNVNKVPGRPPYVYASELPLMLYESAYEVPLEFLYSKKAFGIVTKKVERMYDRLAVKACLHRTVLDAMDNMVCMGSSDKWADEKPREPAYYADKFTRKGEHVSLLSRKPCHTFAQRLEALSQAKKDEVKATHDWDVNDLIARERSFGR